MQVCRGMQGAGRITKSRNASHVGIKYDMKQSAARDAELNLSMPIPIYAFRHLQVLSE